MSKVARCGLDIATLSVTASTLLPVTESQASQVEKVLLHLSNARERAGRAAERVEREGAESHVGEALRQTEQELTNLHRQLSQATYYAVPDPALRLTA